jgi:hypothetical protein
MPRGHPHAIPGREMTRGGPVDGQNVNWARRGRINRGPKLNSAFVNRSPCVSRPPKSRAWRRVPSVRAQRRGDADGKPVSHPDMARREREILERSVHTTAGQAATPKAVDESTEAGLAAVHSVSIAAKQVRPELLKMKADLERECRKNTTNQASHPAISLGVGFVLPNPRPTEASRAPARGADRRHCRPGPPRRNF